MIPISYNFRSLLVRKATTAATALGIALVVFVLSSSMMLSAGIKRTFGKAGRQDHAIVLSNGSDAELTSSIEDPAVRLILEAPGVKRDEHGAGIGAGELTVVVTLEKEGDEGISNVQMRGVPANALSLRPEVHVTAGRPATPGTDEVIVGRRIAGRFKGVALGQSFELRKNRPVQVVGLFEAADSSFESEVWGDLNTLRAAYGREGLVSSVWVRLESPDKFDAFRIFVEQDKRLGLTAMSESDYLRKASEGTSDLVGILGGITAFFFSIGAMIGAMITMHASIASRRREMGTLRALGFSRASVLVSFLIESLTLALVGGIVGLVAAQGMSLVKFSMVNFVTYSEVVFSFVPTVDILVAAFIFAGVMGLFGGLLPAIRAARISPLEAMQR